MSWFEGQCAGRDASVVRKEHGRMLRASGLDRALEELSGPFGVRRYLLRFARRGEQVVVTDLDAIPLPTGGGPPSEDAAARAMAGVEQALTRLHRNMALGPRWDRGAIGVVRDREGKVELFPAFEEDGDPLKLELLPVPPKPGHPLESPEWLRMAAQWAPRVDQVQARSSAQQANRDVWELTGGTLELADGRRLPAQALGTFSPKTRRFTWQVHEPLFPGEVFEWREFLASWDAAMEVGLLAAARLSASWMFVGRIDAEGGVLMVAVKDG